MPIFEIDQIGTTGCAVLLLETCKTNKNKKQARERKMVAP